MYPIYIDGFTFWIPSITSDSVGDILPEKTPDYINTNCVGSVIVH